MFITPWFKVPTRFDKLISKIGTKYKPVKCQLVGNYSMIKGKTVEMTAKDGIIRAPSDHIGILMNFEYIEE